MAYTSNAKMSINTGLDNIYSVNERESTPGKILTPQKMMFDSPPLSIKDTKEAVTEQQLRNSV